MALTRREFLERTALVAGSLLSGHVLARAFAPGVARAAGPVADPILVVVQLEGGNDGLNTVFPVDGPARSLYVGMRPDLALSVDPARPTELGPDPATGDTLALHPALADLHDLYAAGRLAIVQGVGYPNQDLSHFRSEDIWFRADPVGAPPTGWLGNYLDAHVPAGEVRALSLNEIASPIFASLASGVLASKTLSRFVLPTDPYGEGALHRAAWEQAFADAAADPGLLGRIGSAGLTMLEKIDALAAVDTQWGSNLDALSGSLPKRLRDVVSIIRHDALGLGTPTGLRFFHVRQGGYDTHSRQGGAEGNHADLLATLGASLRAFHDDLVALGIDDRVLVMTFSEFGRRPEQNASGASAGTDHGAASVQLLLGAHAGGGLHGPMPDLADLDDKSNLKFHTDFRQVYATVLEDWLGVPQTGLLPGGPFAKLPGLVV